MMSLNLKELQTDDEGFFEDRPAMEGIEPAKVPEVSHEMEEKPKHKRAKNKKSLETEPSLRESRYSHLLKNDSEEEETPEEQVNLDYFHMLHQCRLDKEKERARKRISLPAFAQNTLPEEHPEILALFKNFDAVTPDENVGTALRKSKKTIWLLGSAQTELRRFKLRET